MDSETKGGMWDELREGIPTRRKLISARRALGTKQIWGTYGRALWPWGILRADVELELEPVFFQGQTPCDIFRSSVPWAAQTWVLCQYSLGVEKGALTREGAGQSLRVFYPCGLSLEARPRWATLYPEVLGGHTQQDQRRPTEVRPTGINTGISGQEIPFLWVQRKRTVGVQAWGRALPDAGVASCWTPASSAPANRRFSPTSPPSLSCPNRRPPDRGWGPAEHRLPRTESATLPSPSASFLTWRTVGSRSVRSTHLSEGLLSVRNVSKSTKQSSK